jgi:L-cysteate sulfo-lyase
MIGQMATALATLMSMPAVTLAPHPSPVDRMPCLEQALGRDCPRLFVKRDDLLSFARGGNKVRKLQMIADEVARGGADTVITCGAVQSNHARVTAAAGAVLGWRVILVLSGEVPERPSANFRLDRLFGADIRVVASRGEREAAMAAAAEEATAAGRRPYVIPVGASTPLGAMGMARGVAELGTAGIRPDVIVHASSSGGTQAGLTAGCALFGLTARVMGVSADEPADALRLRVSALLEGMASRLGARAETLHGGRPIEVDDGQVGEGYERSTPASEEAMALVARSEGIVLDPVYTAKAMAGLMAAVRAGRFRPDETVLFWHTGGLSE